ncbi:MAG: sulfotransferase [Pseudomonadota bacterium]
MSDSNSHRVFVHMGLHKTATSALQQHYFNTLDKINFLTTRHPDSEILLKAILRDDPINLDSKLIRSSFDKLMATDKANLISNEALSGPPFSGLVEGGYDHRSSVLSNLSNVLPDARIILVLRRQDRYAGSLYRQYVKSGGTRDIERYYGYNQSRPACFNRNRFDFRTYIQHITETFGRDRVLVLLYEDFVSDLPGFLSNMSDFVGIDFPVKTIKRENKTSFGSFGINVTRYMNFIIRNLVNPGAPLPGIPIKYRKGRGFKLENLSPVELIHDHWKWGSGGKNSMRYDSVLERILDEQREGNRQLSLEYNLDLERYGYC